MQGLKITRLLGSIQDLYAYEMPVLVIVEDEAIGYFLTAIDLPSGQVEIYGIRLTITS
jgi:hypothetical protein